MTTILCNTIAIAMFNPEYEHNIRMKPIYERTAISLLKKNGFEQAVGHPATAEVLALRTGLDVQCNRMNVHLEQNDTLIIAQVVVPRLAEGQVLSKEEVEALPVQWWLVQEV